MYLLCSFVLPIFALSLFLPIIITEMGFTAAHAQLLTVPPYIIALPIVLVFAWLSDKYQLRGPFILIGAVFGISGFAVIMSTTKPWVGYGGAVLGVVGAVVPVSSSLAWIGNNVAGDLKRGEWNASALSVHSSQSCEFQLFSSRLCLASQTTLGMNSFPCQNYSALTSLPISILGSFIYTSVVFDRS